MPPGTVVRPRRRWPGALAGGAALAAAVVVGTVMVAHRPPTRAAQAHATAGAPPAAGPGARYSAADPPPAWPDPLPYPILIADEGDQRLIEVTPGKQAVWTYQATKTTAAATSVAFSGSGADVLAAGEQLGRVEEIDYAARRVVWSFGPKLQSGAGAASSLDYPTEAQPLPDGDVILADVRNCRLLMLDPAGRILASWGRPQSGYCATALTAGLYGYPNGVAPQADGNLLVTLGSGDRVAMLTGQGQLLWDAAVPDLFGAVVSAARRTASGLVLVAGMSDPGSIIEFDPHTGAVAWRYHVASGPGALADPRLAEPLPGGNVLVADTGNNRVVVIDPKTNAIVWQYGGASVLNHPTGVAIDTFRNWLGWVNGQRTAAP